MEQQSELDQVKEYLKDATARLEELSYLLDQAIGRAAGLNKLIREKDQQLEKLQEQNMKLQEQLRGQHSSNVAGVHEVKDQRQDVVEAKA